MSDELSNYLMSGSRHASLSAESLELMGKQAANRLLSEDLPLNESISKLAAAHEDINAEQVKRICEYANTAVYLARHDQNKTAGAGNSYPQFELADPSRIIQDLSDGARSTVSTPVDIEYSKQHQKSKTAGAVGDMQRDDVIDLIFGKNPEEPDYSRATAVKQVMDTKSDLVSMKETLAGVAEHAEMSLKEAQAEYYHLVKQHLMDGGDFSEIIVAAQNTSDDKQKIAEAFRPVIERLLTEKVASPVALQVMTERLEKVAHRIVNGDHPLVTTFKNILTLSEEVEKTASAYVNVDAQLGRVQGFIEENFLGTKTKEAISKGFVERAAKSTLGKLKPKESLDRARKFSGSMQRLSDKAMDGAGDGLNSAKFDRAFGRSQKAEEAAGVVWKTDSSLHNKK